MKKLLYITNAYGNYKKKILGQLGGFRKCNMETFLCCYDHQTSQYSLFHIMENDTHEVINQYETKWNCQVFYKYVENIITEYEFDYYYFRRFGISIILFGGLIQNLAKKLKKIVYEIPTFPFDNATSIPRKICQVIENKYLKNNIFPYVHCLPTCVSMSDVILPDKMISIDNCVDSTCFINFADLPMPNYAGKEINFVAVAHTQYWHGYDRFIRSMALWKDRFKIKFTVYGNYTQETQKLIKLCEELELKNVKFLEEKDISNFEDFISQFHIAVGCLGLFRRTSIGNIAIDTSIKNKEYCAMGLPFIHSSEDISFNTDLNFHLLLPDDESEIDINNIVQWYIKFRIEVPDRKKMWNYARYNLDFIHFAKKIINFNSEEV